MSEYRARQEAAGALPAFESARRNNDYPALERILKHAGFASLEIESILWAKGDLGTEKVGTLSDQIIGHLGRAIVGGCIVGGEFVYSFGGFSGLRPDRAPAQERASERIFHDFRSPTDAY